VVSVSIAGLFGSYLLVSVLLLWRRCTGGIVSGNKDDASITGSSIPAEEGYTPIVWGPWRIKGVLGIANNAFACAYLAFVLFFSFWPTFAKVTPQNMNWSILVTGVLAIFSTVYYLVWGKKTYKGPIVEVEPRYLETGYA
jgi:choline transport protein